MHACAVAYIYIYIYVGIYVCICACTCTFTCTCICMCRCLYVCVCVEHIHIHITCVYVYSTQTFTNMNSNVCVPACLHLSLVQMQRARRSVQSLYRPGTSVYCLYCAFCCISSSGLGLPFRRCRWAWPPRGGRNTAPEAFCTKVCVCVRVYQSMRLLVPG